MNMVAMAGYVITHPEIKQVGDTRVARLRLAVKFAGPKKEGGGRDDAVWSVEAWGKQADFVEKNIKQHSAITVSGELRMDKYTDKQGNPREQSYVEAMRVSFAPVSRDKPAGDDSGSAPDQGSGGGSSPSGGGSPAKADYDPYDV